MEIEQPNKIRIKELQDEIIKQKEQYEKKIQELNQKLLENPSKEHGVFLETEKQKLLKEFADKEQAHVLEIDKLRAEVESAQNIIKRVGQDKSLLEEENERLKQEQKTILANSTKDVGQLQQDILKYQADLNNKDKELQDVKENIQRLQQIYNENIERMKELNTISEQRTTRLLQLFDSVLTGGQKDIAQLLPNVEVIRNEGFQENDVQLIIKLNQLILARCDEYAIAQQTIENLEGEVNKLRNDLVQYNQLKEEYGILQQSEINAKKLNDDYQKSVSDLQQKWNATQLLLQQNAAEYTIKLGQKDQEKLSAVNEIVQQAEQNHNKILNVLKSEYSNSVEQYLKEIEENKALGKKYEQQIKGLNDALAGQPELIKMAEQKLTEQYQQTMKDDKLIVWQEIIIEKLQIYYEHQKFQLDIFLAKIKEWQDKIKVAIVILTTQIIPIFETQFDLQTRGFFTQGNKLLEWLDDQIILYIDTMKAELASELINVQAIFSSIKTYNLEGLQKIQADFTTKFKKYDKLQLAIFNEKETIKEVITTNGLIIDDSSVITMTYLINALNDKSHIENLMLLLTKLRTLAIDIDVTPIHIQMNTVLEIYRIMNLDEKLKSKLYGNLTDLTIPFSVRQNLVNKASKELLTKWEELGVKQFFAGENNQFMDNVSYYWGNGPASFTKGVIVDNIQHMYISKTISTIQEATQEKLPPQTFDQYIKFVIGNVYAIVNELEQDQYEESLKTIVSGNDYDIEPASKTIVMEYQANYGEWHCQIFVKDSNTPNVPIKIMPFQFYYSKQTLPNGTKLINWCLKFSQQTAIGGNGDSISDDRWHYLVYNSQSAITFGLTIPQEIKFLKNEVQLKIDELRILLQEDIGHYPFAQSPQSFYTKLREDINFDPIWLKLTQHFNQIFQSYKPIYTSNRDKATVESNLLSIHLLIVNHITEQHKISKESYDYEFPWSTKLIQLNHSPNNFGYNQNLLLSLILDIMQQSRIGIVRSNAQDMLEGLLEDIYGSDMKRFKCSGHNPNKGDKFISLAYKIDLYHLLLHYNINVNPDVAITKVPYCELTWRLQIIQLITLIYAQILLIPDYGSVYKNVNIKNVWYYQFNAPGLSYLDWIESSNWLNRLAKQFNDNEQQMQLLISFIENIPGEMKKIVQPKQRNIDLVSTNPIPPEKILTNIPKLYRDYIPYIIQSQ